MTGFGKQLVESVHEPWAEHYVRYKILKKIIKLIAAAESSPVSVATARAKLAGLAPAELPLLERQVQEGALSRIALEQFWEEILEVEHGRVKSFSLATREKLEDQAKEPPPSPGDLVPDRWRARAVAEATLPVRAWVPISAGPSPLESGC